MMRIERFTGTVAVDTVSTCAETRAAGREIEATTGAECPETIYEEFSNIFRLHPSHVRVYVMPA